MSYLPGKFVWFEHMSADSATARKFYESLFDWHTEMMPMGGQRYPMIMNGNDGIGGYGNAKAGSRSAWLSYLSVTDVDSAHAAALAAGAATVTPPTDYGTVGRGSTITDPTGAMLSLWKSAQGDQPDVQQAPVGAWCWNELWTTDDTKALDFYERTFGYSRDSMDMGPQGTYYMLKRDGVARAGLMRATNSQAGSMWLPYVAVADCDATASRAKALGGQVVHAPSEVPGVGRFAILVDTVGAAVAAIKLTPA
jgi:predicted enzyme related to lactoylglutathione lyase